jgi:lysyl-tRNA synthetase class 2
MCYPAGFRPSHTVQEFVEEFTDLPKGAREVEGSVVLAGRVVAKRDASKKLIFCDLASGNSKVQMISEKQYYEGSAEEGTPEEQFKQIHTEFRRGDIIGVRGFPGKSNKGQLSVIPRSIELLAPCVRELPAAKDGLKDPDVRFRKRYIDLLVNEGVMQTFVTRAAVIRFLRNFLEQRQFIEVETPILCSSAGGAAARPFTTHLRAFDLEQQLRIAPELSLKKLIVGGFERVYEIGKVFRNEGVDPSHNPGESIVYPPYYPY